MTRSELLDELSDRILKLDSPHPIRVAINGVDAAGKTTLADELVSPLEDRGAKVIRASVDSFLRPRECRYRRGRESPEGYYYDAFDYVGVKSYLLDPLGPEGDLNYRSEMFDGHNDKSINSQMKKADSDSVLLFDGVFLFRLELLNCWELRIFVDVDSSISLERGIQRERDPSAARILYEHRYIPGQQIYLRECDPKKLADVVVNNNDIMNPTITAVDHE